MDSGKSSSQPSSLDSLRTVEFRQTLRGYHIDDVDDYLERVAVEAEALQEHLRQANERTKQAAERVAQLEQMLSEREGSGPAEREHAPAVSDDTLQRTLLLAQKFVDQTKSEAEAQARTSVSKAEEQARSLLLEAEAKAHTITEEAARKKREEVDRLESLRAELAEDVETIARHLEGERKRLRTALVDMLAWVDKQIEPGSSGSSEHPERPAPQAQPGQQSDGGHAQMGGHELPRASAAHTAGGR
ncbi:MAG TPA: DivIVA domain-containing protein [Acidimicrobiales bacterium]|nr:DivIVA domain-containing protein [Acidimicrobiales bacterium]